MFFALAPLAAQVVSAGVFAVSLLSVFRRKRERRARSLRAFNIFGAGLSALCFLLLGSPSTAALCGILGARSAARSTAWGARHRELLLVLSMLSAFLTTGTLSQSLLEWLPLAGTVFGSVAENCDQNGKAHLYFVTANVALWLPYGVSTGALGLMATYVFGLCMDLWGIYTQHVRDATRLSAARAPTGYRHDFSGYTYGLAADQRTSDAAARDPMSGDDEGGSPWRLRSARSLRRQRRSSRGYSPS